MIEVKQGPYAGDHDKTRFRATLPAQLNYGNCSDRPALVEAKSAVETRT